MKFISILTPCFNEEENVEELYLQVKQVFERLPEYRYEHIFIDNGSQDATLAKLKAIASVDRNVKIIANTRNFGPVRSPYYGMLQTSGEAAIILAADFQDPPYMIEDFLKKWEEGYKVVQGVKTKSEESPVMFAIRSLYYNFIGSISNVQLTKNCTGFGLYDRQVLNVLRQIDDAYPYFRGLISELGFESAKIPFTQPLRKRGITKHNFYMLYDIAMLGITSHSKVPIRFATMLGFALSIISLLIAFGYFIAKLLFWNNFILGQAPILISMFFFASIQLFFMGILGEYIVSIHTQVLKRPLVIEKERINF